jgi:HAD superfamily hydrolase (TIGR01458 family)
MLSSPALVPPERPLNGRLRAARCGRMLLRMRVGRREINGLLIDLDGVLHVGRRPVAGAVDKIAALRGLGMPHCYVTNTTTRPVSELCRELSQMGFAIDAESILSAPMAARGYLESKHNPRCKLLLRREVLAEFGDFRQSDSGVDAVVVGDIGAAWSYELLNDVFRLLMEGAELIALHRNRFWQTEAGLQLDIGAFIAGLEYATGKQATMVGKPSAAFFREALKRLGLPVDQVAMIGDDIDSDIGGAQALGMAGILVKTGKYRRDYAERSGVRPDLQLRSFADLPL